MTVQTPHLLPRDAGVHYAFLNTRASVKVGGDRTNGVLTVIECLAPLGFGPPLHRHDVEDELFHVTEGQLRVQCGETDEVLGVGGTVWLPKGLAHTFQVTGDGPCRFLQISTPAQFEDFCEVLGTKQDDAGLPEPTEVDPAEVARVCAEFQIEVLGPPPAPLS